MLRKIFMAAVIVVLVLVILVTPRFIGGPELSSLPQLIIDHVDNQTKIYVQPSFGRHRYSTITISVKDLNHGGSYTITENNTYMLHCIIDDSYTTYFILNITVIDKIGEDDSSEFYDYNCTIEVGSDPINDPIFNVLKEGKKPIQIIGEGNLPYIAILERRT